jgi:hypothetical protein
MQPRSLTGVLVTGLFTLAAIAAVSAQPAGEPALAPEQRLLIIRRTEGTPAALQPSDQYLRASRSGDDTEVSFRFTDSDLTFVLSPLADLLAAPVVPATAAASGAAPQVVQALRVSGAAGAAAAVPLSASLVIEDESARERKVSVSGEHVSLAAAIALIAKASDCNIFRDGTTLVVDYCAAR